MISSQSLDQNEEEELQDVDDKEISDHYRHADKQDQTDDAEWSPLCEPMVAGETLILNRRLQLMNHSHRQPEKYEAPRGIEPVAFRYDLSLFRSTLRAGFHFSFTAHTSPT